MRRSMRAPGEDCCELLLWRAWGGVTHLSHGLLLPQSR